MMLQYILEVIYEEHAEDYFSWMIDHRNTWVNGLCDDIYAHTKCHITHNDILWIEWGDIAAMGYIPYTVTTIEL